MFEQTSKKIVYFTIKMMCACFWCNSMLEKNRRDKKRRFCVQFVGGITWGLLYFSHMHLKIKRSFKETKNEKPEYFIFIYKIQ